MTACDDIFVKTKRKKMSMWKNPMRRSEIDVYRQIISMKTTARLAKDDSGEKVFTKEDLNLLEPIFQKVKEIGLNCID